MSVSGLKAELKFLASIFDKNHERFRIVSWKLDELHCQFLVPPPPGSPHSPPLLTLHCNITESYPSSSPIWFVDSDDPNLTSVLERLEDSKNNSSLRQQLKWLICELCRLYNLPKHLDVETLDQPLPTGQRVNHCLSYMSLWMSLELSLLSAVASRLLGYPPVHFLLQKDEEVPAGRDQNSIWIPSSCSEDKNKRICGSFGVKNARPGCVWGPLCYLYCCGFF